MTPPPRGPVGKATKAVISKAPSLREERRLLREGGHRYLVGIDEVGRGSLAGPVSVGVVVVDVETKSAPAGVRDSKLLTPAAREALAPKIRRWAPMWAVGHAGPDEIDAIGIIAALRLAACRALESLPVRPTCALLDGSHNWLAIPAAPDEEPLPPALFELEAVAVPTPAEVRAELVPSTIVTRIKADMRCAAVAAASVLAKVERDAIMVELAPAYPEYRWELNKGYSAPEHTAALRRIGPCELHRRSWNLPGLTGEPGYGDQLDLGALAAGAAPGFGVEDAVGEDGQVGSDDVLSRDRGSSVGEELFEDGENLSPGRFEAVEDFGTIELPDDSEVFDLPSR